jgi:hypothetical protein
MQSWAQPGLGSGLFLPASISVAAKGDDLPSSREDLFGTPAVSGTSPVPVTAGKAAREAPTSKDALFELDAPADKSAPPGEAPASRDALFDLPPVKEQAAGQPPALARDVLPESKDDLFGIAPPAAGKAIPGEGVRPGAAQPAGEKGVPPVVASSPAPRAGEPAGPGLRGFFQSEFAYARPSPARWSKSIGRLELGTQGRLANGIQWKIGGRLDVVGEYDHYNGWGPGNSRLELSARENYVDFSASDWEIRLGRQHIVWGEMVGMFVADVVSAKDLRDFILPDFSVLRIPQWAARAEYFADDFHAELIWIPFPSYDRIGKQGADFYPYPPALAPVIRAEEKPGYRLANGNFGARLSRIKNGWDVSGFFYRSMDAQQTFYRDAANPNLFTPRHDSIWQLGGTLAKDVGDFVLKAEAVYTDGRKYSVTNAVDPDGLAPQNTLDWALGLDLNPNTETRVNAQLYQRVYFNHHPDIIPDQHENGYSLLVNYKFSNNLEAEALWVRSLNRDDWMLRPKLTWGFRQNWRLVLGLDYFHGPATGIFGQYNRNDRAYAELRYDF